MRPDGRPTLLIERTALGLKAFAALVEANRPAA
jgi:hypothetical protein